MKIAINLILDCDTKLQEIKEYYWNTPNEKQNEVEVSRYESYINFRRIGLMWYCPVHNDEHRIKDMNIHVVEFDARREIV
jgi:hypothetical protein